MKKLYPLMMLTLLVVACGQQPPATPATPPPPPAAVAKPHGTLRDLMRTIPFPNSNVIFDAQNNDPDKRQAKEKAAAEKAGAGDFQGIYGGWQGVEESAVALSETANLLLVPGRTCSNGKPVPVERPDWQKYVQGLADAGEVALKAAKTKNMDNIVDAAGTVTEACAACHMVYRDQPEPKERCTP